jgi:hypothetical protein
MLCEARQLSALAAQAAAAAPVAVGPGAPLLCMECCAGRGRLSAAVQGALGGRGHPMHHVLIDRCVTRNGDARLREAAEGMA